MEASFASSSSPAPAVAYDFHGLSRGRVLRNTGLPKKQRPAKYGRCAVCKDFMSVVGS